LGVTVGTVCKLCYLICPPLRTGTFHGLISQNFFVVKAVSCRTPTVEV